jgi:H+/Cl- antiporter ClcA
MLTIAVILVFIVQWLLLYGLCSLVNKHHVSANYLTFNAFIGLCAGLTTLFVIWSIFLINSHNSEQHEGAMWMLLLVGFPISWVYSFIPQFLVKSTLCDSLLLSVFVLVNYSTIGLSVGCLKYLANKKDRPDSHIS